MENRRSPWRKFQAVTVHCVACSWIQLVSFRGLRWQQPSLRANISETVLVLLINERGEKEKGRDEREFSRCCSFSWGFGWRGTERRLAF